jgi:hypothetical protein
MLKLFYKTLLVSLLCGSLMLLDFSYKGISLNNLRAESVKTEGVKDSNLMATLTMTAVGLLASRLWTCNLTTDMLIAAAGGAAFIGGEVLSFIKLKEVMKDIETSIERDKKGNINQEQKAALERLKKSYEEAKETAEFKKTLQQAAAAAFAAAAVVAYTFVATETTMFAACKEAISLAGTTCVGLAPAAGTTISLLLNLETGRWIPTPSAAGKAAELAADGTEKVGQATQAANATTLAASYTTTCGTVAGAAACPLIEPCAAAPAAVTTACAPITPTLSQSSGFCPASLVVNNSPQNFTPNELYASHNSVRLTILNLLAHAFSPNEARADLFSPMGIASGLAIKFLIATSTTLGPTIDSYLLAPMNRAIIWGVLAGLTFAASSATDNVISQIDSNIQKIDAILNGMNSWVDGTTTTNTQKPPVTEVKNKTQPKLNIEAKKYDAVDISKSPQGQLPCFTGPDPKNCKSFEDVNKDLPSNNLLDKNTQTQIASMLKTANGFNGTSKITSGTFEGADQLAKSANALFANMEKKKAALKEKLKKLKSKFNPNAQTKKFSDLLQATVKKNLKNSSAKDMIGEMYGSKIR